jgi:hypothetical protein
VTSHFIIDKQRILFNCHQLHPSSKRHRFVTNRKTERNHPSRERCALHVLRRNPTAIKHIPNTPRIQTRLSVWQGIERSAAAAVTKKPPMSRPSLRPSMKPFIMLDDANIPKSINSYVSNNTKHWYVHYVLLDIRVDKKEHEETTCVPTKRKLLGLVRLHRPRTHSTLPSVQPAPSPTFDTFLVTADSLDTK